MSDWHNKLAALNLKNSIGVAAAEFSATDVVIRDMGGIFKAMTRKKDGGLVEGIFAVVGCVGDLTFPPVTFPRAKEASKNLLLQQASISGYGSQEFMKAYDFVAEMDDKFATAILTTPITQFAASSGPIDEEGGMSLTASSRYFTKSKDPLSQHERRAIPPDVDPYGALGRLETTRAAYCTDNVVKYLKIAGSGSKYATQQDTRTTLTCIRLVSRDPSLFRPREIVQLKFAVHAFRKFSPEAGPSFTVKLVLRSVVFLDGTIADRIVALERRTLKRKCEDAKKDKTRDQKRQRRGGNPLADVDYDAETDSGAETDDTVRGVERMQLDGERR
uniref:Uncharacterized protein n=1 Tax=Mycena chlorophos TaxID=658473 RepID=A0ABQ0L0Y8_MYCCL|nr:predicted protein [Mycena chlorophos]